MSSSLKGGSIKVQEKPQGIHTNCMCNSLHTENKNDLFQPVSVNSALLAQV